MFQFVLVCFELLHLYARCFPLIVYAGGERLAIACGDCNVRVWQMDHPRYVYKSHSLWKSIQSKVLFTH